MNFTKGYRAHIFSHINQDTDMHSFAFKGTKVQRLHSKGTKIASKTKTSVQTQ